MSNKLARIFLGFLALGGIFTKADAQLKNTTDKEDPAYVKVIQERVAKIVGPLQLKDQQKQQQVQRVIEQQYYDLNRIDGDKQNAVTGIKNSKLSSDGQKEAIEAIQAKSDAQIAALHPQFVGRLSALLNKQQVAEIKDGMTYHTLEVTYGAYTDMLPDLTAQQKSQIRAWLEEAREHAIDAGSSKEKHAWFGKYKGRINNYLSKEGVDMKEAEIAWKKRRESEK